MKAITTNLNKNIFNISTRNFFIETKAMTQFFGTLHFSNQILSSKFIKIIRQVSEIPRSFAASRSVPIPTNQLDSPSTEVELLSSRSPPPPPCFLGFRLRVWMPSLRMARGLLTPCSLKYKPQALHTGSPSLFRRQSVVVLVPQFVQQRPKRLVAVCKKKRLYVGELSLMLGETVFF